MTRKGSSLSRRLYGLLLVVCPAGFRREYGREMSLVFEDRCRELGQRDGAAGFARVWCEAVFDLAAAAAREHAVGLLAGGGFMRIARTILLALVAYAAALLFVAPLYLRNRESVPAFVGNMADALIATGIVFNAVFLILTLPRIAEGVRAVRIATLVTALVVAGLMTMMVMSGGPLARPHFSVYVAQVLSLFVWWAAHTWWVLRRGGGARPPAPA